MNLRVVVMALLLGGVPVTAAAKEYAAERFDSRITVLRGGSLEVTETVVFRFFGGTFTQVYRQIPARRTNGIEIIRATMDGVPTPLGDSPGQIEVSGTSRVRVRWRFAPVADSTHTFELTYVAHAVVFQETGADVVKWRALPSEHAYPIASSTVDFELPVSPLSPPSLDVRRVGGSTIEAEGTHVRFSAAGIRKNGWLEATIRLPLGSIIDAPPQWQQRAERVAAGSRTWVIAGAAVFGVGLLVLFAIRQSYDRPPSDVHVKSTGPAFPDSLAPELAGALLTNGSPRLEHAMAVLFSLAERGEISIDEQGKSLGQRAFAVTRTPTGRPVSEIEKALYDTIFESRKGRDTSVSLATARSRLVSHSKAFNAAIERELNRAGLIDEGRTAVRRRYGRIAVLALILSLVALVPAVLMIDRHGPWTLLVPGGIALVSLVAAICMAAHTPLSNEAVRRAAYWRGFQQHLRDVARDRAAAPMETAHLLPFAVALGMAGAWAKFLKNHKSGVPGWFHALGSADGSPAFVAFVSTGGSAHSGSAGGGGAAGGGASGAS